ncbi:MAG: DAK2 domain-containing protein [Clostridia bacterium]|nr:DAK2 domain-containing protein [Clostridia bacterium]
MLKNINANTFRKIITSGVKLLDANKQHIDSLNVFPVPDGDTGTNMSLTLKSSLAEMNEYQGNNLDTLAESVSKGALKGARGNSGVITSQILRGFCSVIKENKEIDTKTFAKALKSGTEIAYNAVSKPKEGTMLTVIRIVAESALAVSKKENDFEKFLPQIIEAGENILEKTPDMLPVLKKAGVVDAGGKGLVIMFKGMLKGVLGEEIEETEQLSEESTGDVSEHADLLNLGDIEFAYCTEFFIINLNKKTTKADIDKLRETYLTLGDCVLVIGDLDFVKVHVHTNMPGKLLEAALSLGEIDKIKIENMLEQNRQLVAQREAEKKEQGMLSVCAGKGLKNIFKDLLVDAVLEGGQTMNPSANDIAEAASRINCDHVFIFPNNKNIILAAQQANALIEGKQLHVIPTKNIPQGLAAALAFNPDATVEENAANMSSVLDTVNAGQVTYAVRSTEVDGFKLKKGDIIGLDHKNILTKGSDINEVTTSLIDKTLTQNHTMITLYYGEDVKEEDANLLKEQLQEKYSDCEVDCYYGGQPIYYYIVSLE